MGERRLEELIYIGARRLIENDKKHSFVSSEEFFVNNAPLEANTIIFGVSPYLYQKRNNLPNKVNFKDIEKKISMLTYKKIIFLSSASVYGFNNNKNMFSEKDDLLGTTTYAEEKIRFESMIIQRSKKINSSCIIMRIAGLYELNPNIYRIDNFLDKIFFNLRDKKKVKLNLFHAGNQIRNFCSINFLKKVIDNLICNHDDSVIYNVANTSSIKLINLIQKLNYYLKTPLHIDMQISTESFIHNSLNCSALLRDYPELSYLVIDEDKLAKIIAG